MTGRPPVKWLSLAQVAQLMQIEHPSRHYRVQYVRRLLRRLELRDGTAYLRRFGDGKRGRLWVSPSALEQLEPHSPAAMGKLREDVDENREETRAIQRKVNAHGSRIVKLEKFKAITEEYFGKLREL